MGLDHNQTQLAAIPHMLAVAGGKGGIGKTTWATEMANVAVQEHGFNVLLVEADPQANGWRQLGLPQSDGEPMLEALIQGEPLPVHQARPGLDVAMSGEAMFYFDRKVQARRLEQRDFDMDLAWFRALEPIADNYDLIVFDLPPGEKFLVEAIMAISGYVVAVTTAIDDASLDGMDLIAKRMTNSDNPDLTLLGVGLFAVSRNHAYLEEWTRDSLEAMLGGAVPVFDNTIRMNLTAAHDSRRRGLLSNELKDTTQAARKERFRRMRLKKAGQDIDLRDTAAPRTSAKIAAELAEDHRNLANEVLEAMSNQLAASRAGE